MQIDQEGTAAENARQRLRTLNLLVLAVSPEDRISIAENALPFGFVEGSEI